LFSPIVTVEKVAMNSLEMTVNHITSKMLDSPLQAGAVSLATISICYLTVKGVQRILTKDLQTHSYPPGPPRKPFIGALTSFPKDHIYQRFNEWAALYGKREF
jgi:hypothetical protein